MSQPKKCILSNGLCVLSAKKKTNNLVILALTDFNQTGKFIFDTIDKKIIRSTANLKFSDNDFDLLQSYIKNNEKSQIAGNNKPQTVGN